MKNKTAVIIVAGGSGSRFGGQTPKQFLLLSGKHVIDWSIEKFEGFKHIVAVVPEKAVFQSSNVQTVPAGETRQQSVYNGLKALEKFKPEFVLIHDAARPVITSDILNNLLEKLKNCDAVIPAIPLSGTIKNVGSDGFINDTIPRDNMWEAQTPQAFRYQTIFDLHKRAEGMEFTDDAGICEAYGVKVSVIKGEKTNIKLTTKEDWEIMQKLLENAGRFRAGTGFDVHKFGSPRYGAEVALCGVKIPHISALKGHSDADVGLHAITDAILGAAALGDLGEHFPDTDKKWKNADSAVFLSHAYNLAKTKGYQISNIDLTIICEQPKVSPHREAMRKRISEILEISMDKISIKATTTEGLGFAGRSEGIAAQAIATLIN